MSRPLQVGAVMYDPKVSVIWEIIRDFFDAQGAPIDVAFYTHLRAQIDGAARPARSTSPGTRRSRGSTRSGDPATAAAPSPCATPIAIASRYFVARRGGPVQTLADLQGRTIADRRDRLAAGHAHPARPPAPRGAQPRSGRHGPAVRRPRRQARRSRRRRARRAGLPHAGRGRGVRDARPELGRLDQGRHDRRERVQRSSAKPIVSTTASSRSARSSTPRPRRRGSTRSSPCATTIPRTAR